MPAPLSVIIPTLNSAQSIGPTMRALWEGVETGLIAEVILVDGGSTDEIAEIAEALGADFVTSVKGRGTQLAAGAEAAKGAWLLFLHADTELSDGWASVVLAHLNSSKKAGYGRLAFNANGFAPAAVAGWANLRSRVFGLPYGDQGLLISQELYRRSGGFQDIPLMEDVAIARALKGNLTALGFIARTNADRYERDGWIKRGWRNLTTLALYFLGNSPEKLVARYNSQSPK